MLSEDLTTVSQGDDPSAGTTATDPSATPAPVPDGNVATPDAGLPEETEPDTAASDGADEDLDDDTVNAFLDAYKDRILSSDVIKGELTRQVREEVARRVDETERSQQADSTLSELRQQGQQAVGALANQFAAAQTELNRIAQAAQAGATEDLKVNTTVLDGNSFGANLRSYGAAIAGHVKDVYERALETGFEDVFTNDLPAVNDEQAEELTRIINTFQRMEGDLKQSDKAIPYYFQELLRFVSARAREAGAEAMRVQFEGRRGLKDKIVNQNAVAAARAKLERERVPPTTAPSRGTDITQTISMDAYRQALTDAKKGTPGAKERADEIVRTIATRQSLGTPT